MSTSDQLIFGTKIVLVQGLIELLRYTAAFVIALPIGLYPVLKYWARRHSK